MKKIVLGFSFLMLTMISEMSFAQRICVPSGTHTVACYDVGGSIPSGLVQPPAVNTSFGPSFNTAAHQQKQCADEKGKIENEYGKCMYETALDYQREVSRCNEIGNSEASISGGGSWGGEFRGVFLSATYTIQDPTYEKCFNLVTALNNTGEKLCAVRKANQEDIARKWINAQCKDFYM